MKIRPLLLPIPLLVLAFAAGCDKPNNTEDYYLRSLTLPDGAVIKVESMASKQDMMRGMMFRTSLAPDRGMLFTHGSPGNYTYWMFQVQIPLDILWLDDRRRVVEISANTPPCPNGPASNCPAYGGKQTALYVVELGAGVAAKHGVKLGDTLRF